MSFIIVFKPVVAASLFYTGLEIAERNKEFDQFSPEISCARRYQDEREAKTGYALLVKSRPMIGSFLFIEEVSHG